MQTFSGKELERLLKLPPATLRTLIQASGLRPVRERGRIRYSFQDLLVLRTATALRAARVPLPRITRTLRRLRLTLPPETALSRLSLSSEGARILVREGAVRWEPESGQCVLALEARLPASGVSVIAPDETGMPAESDAPFFEALALEEVDPEAARRAYEACLARDARNVEARLNLGRLLHLSGRLDEAEQVYRDSEGADALLAFNLGVLLEDLGREPEARRSYRDALALDPSLADAHFNLARLHERAGEAREALRHLLAYRRAMPPRSA